MFQHILRTKGDAGGKLKRLKKHPIVARGFEPAVFQHRGDILRCQPFAVRSREPPGHTFGGKVDHDLAQFTRSRLVRSEGCRVSGVEPQQAAGRAVIPVGKKELRGFVCGPATGPRQLLSVRSEHRQAVKAGGIGDPHRIGAPFSVHNIQLEVPKTVQVGRKDQIVTGRVKVRRPGHGA